MEHKANEEQNLLLAGSVGTVPGLEGAAGCFPAWPGLGEVGWGVTSSTPPCPAFQAIPAAFSSPF